MKQEEVLQELLNLEEMRQDFLNKKRARDALWVAITIDKEPRNDTREIACKRAFYAYRYAKEIDKGPRDDTRIAACKRSKYAYYYATEVDKELKDETWDAVKKTEWEEKYLAFFNAQTKEEII